MDFFFFSSVISNQSIRLLYELMCWLSLVLRSPPGRRSLSWIQSLLIELWLLVIEVSALSLIILTTQTMVTTGIFPLQGKIPMVEPGIERGTSWLVVRSSDHQTTRLVSHSGDSEDFRIPEIYEVKSISGVLTFRRNAFLSSSYPISLNLQAVIHSSVMSEYLYQTRRCYILQSNSSIYILSSHPSSPRSIVTLR